MRQRWILLGMLGACSAGEPDSRVVAPQTPPRCIGGGLTVSPSALTLDIGANARLSRSLAGCSVGSDTSLAHGNVLWDSSAPLVASVDSAGNVTAVRAGNATIRARLRRNTAFAGASQVSVR